ncbi:MAG: iron ABC transporter permease [Candidatus Bathyarchaeota archaeon]|nr:MAG: iron ABC transporter permease [Candidatus Bathyarchaeota archaeon]
MSTALLTIFIIAPIATVVFNAFEEPNGTIGFQNFINFWATPSFRRGLQNSVICAFLTLGTTSVIGIPVAYVMTRYDFPAKRLFNLLTILPLMVPPFVGALALTNMLGRNGAITNFLQSSLNLPLEGGLLLPNIAGIVFIQTFHLWPLIYLNTSASLSKIDPTLEESARNLGASGFTLFRKITLPLSLPGFAAGALLVFLWSLADIGTPIMTNFTEYSVFQAYKELTIQEGYKAMASVIAIVITAISALALLTVNRYVGLKEYATTRAGAAPRAIQKSAGKKASVLILISLSLLVVISIIPHLGTVVMAFTLGPAYGEWLPRGVTLEFLTQTFGDPTSSLAVANSLIYSFLASFVDIFLGAMIAYLLVRKNFLGKSFLDFISMMPFAIPGVVMGLGYIYLFSRPIIGNFRLTSIWYILVISYSMRRLPYSVRSSTAVLRQVHESLEESARNMGASRLKTLTLITIPLIMPGLIAGAILTFINSFTEVSTSLLLKPLIGPLGFYARPLTLQILLEAKGGPTAIKIAACLGLVQIIVTSVGLYLTNKLLGGKAGLAFGG